MGRLYGTAYSAAEVANGLGVNDSRVRQRRSIARCGPSTMTARGCFPPFSSNVLTTAAGDVAQTVRGLDRVLPQLLLKIFTRPRWRVSPEAATRIADCGTTASVRDWLLHGGAVEPVHVPFELGDWGLGVT